MPDMIQDGRGTGERAGVDSRGRLTVTSESSSLQHVISREERQAFQIIGTATLAAGAVVVLHGKNNHTSKDMVFTYIRHQVLDHSGGTALPNASNYFRLALNRTRSSGGAAVTPVQLFANAGEVSQTTWYDTAPTLAGTAAEFDRWYTKAEGDMHSFNKEGTVIVPPNGTIEAAYVGDQSSGTVYCRMSFIMTGSG